METNKVEKEASSLSKEKLLLSFLAVSLLFNVFLVVHANGLSSQVSTLTGVVGVMSTQKQVSSVISGSQADVTTTTLSQKMVNINILNDERCIECDVQPLVAKLKEVFPTANFVMVDYSSDLGKQMFKDAGVKYLPAVLFDSSAVGSSGYSQVQSYLSPAGSYQTLAIGAAYDPLCHNVDGSVKCDDAKCSSDTQCRTNIDKKLDLFIMSHCPYGIQALNSLKEVFGAVKDLKFNIHFIADYSNTTGSFNSLHGQTEVDDNMRELCAMKYYPDNNKYMDFIWCRNNDISNAVWESCATSNGMDAAKIAGCVKTEGVDLLKENIKLSKELEIGASPTWLANNKYEFSGLAAQDIKTGICKYNVGMVGCDKTLTGASASTQAAANCATQ